MYARLQIELIAPGLTDGFFPVILTVSRRLFIHWFECFLVEPDVSVLPADPCLLAAISEQN